MQFAKPGNPAVEFEGFVAMRLDFLRHLPHVGKKKSKNNLKIKTCDYAYLPRLHPDLFTSSLYPIYHGGRENHGGHVGAHATATR